MTSVLHLHTSVFSWKRQIARVQDKISLYLLQNANNKIPSSRDVWVPQLACDSHQRSERHSIFRNAGFSNELIKTTKRHHFSRLRLAKIKKKQNAECWQGTEGTRTVHSAGGS